MASWPVRVLAWMIIGSALVAGPSFAAPPAPAEPPSLPVPPVALKVTPGSVGSPWRLQIENAGEGPVRIPADPRLLILELTPSVEPEPGDKKKRPTPTPPRCVLPDDVRPTTDEGRDLVIPSKRSWSTTFDPLFYCFGARERAALVPGTSVKARFGWPAPAPRPGAKPGRAPALAPPFAVAPVGAAVGKVAPAKAIEADPFVLSEAVTITRPPSEKDAPDGASPTVTLSVPEAMDSARGVEIATTVTLVNGSDRPVTLLYRPDMLLFTVSGPSGNVSCGLPRQVTAPIRELFNTVPAKGKLEVGVLLTATCPPGTFDEPGIYRVVPKLDASGASGRELGMKTWDGIATAKDPLLLRVRAPRKTTLPSPPTLD